MVYNEVKCLPTSLLAREKDMRISDYNKDLSFGHSLGDQFLASGGGGNFNLWTCADGLRTHVI